MNEFEKYQKERPLKNEVRFIPAYVKIDGVKTQVYKATWEPTLEELLVFLACVAINCELKSNK